MNLIQLKYFVAVCNEGSVLGASEVLHISQPSLSAAIKSLESEYGVKLFRRHHKGMSLTEEGQELLRLSGGLIKYADEVDRIMNDASGKKRILRLGVPPMIGSVMLPKIYKEYLFLHPETKIEISEEGRNELLKNLTDKRLDAVLLPHNTPFEKKFTAVKVCSFEIVCCTSGARGVSKFDTVTPEKLKDEPIVLFKNSFFQTEQIKKWFANAGVVPKIILQTDQLSTLKNLITSGVATGFMFRSLISPKEGLKAITLDKPMPVTVSLVRESDGFITSAVKSFTEYMKNYKN